MRILIRNDQPEKNSDYILIMMGHVMDRTPHAISLYQQGYGQKIIFAEAQSNKMIRRGFRTPDGQATLKLLTEANIPKDDITFLADTRNSSSRDEVEAVLQYLSLTKPEARRIILVTSWYHSSRAHWIAERMNKTSIVIESYPSSSPSIWWKNEGDFLAVYNEYLKWLYYLLKY